MSAAAPEELSTVLDFLRYAVTRFEGAGLSYGHGTGSALDEAAFLVGEALELPSDRLEAFLPAALTRPERARLAALIETRVETRTPAPYLVGRAYVQGVRFRCDARALAPRSFIGELLAGPAFAGGEGALVEDPFAVTRVLDLCTGGGSIAILAAMRFENATVDAVDLSADALSLAAENVTDHGLGARVRLFEGDLFAPLADARYDLILTNPPYVDAAAMAALPAEYRAEPALALAGGEDGFDIVRRILAGAPAHLAGNGGLLCEIGTDAGVLDTEFPHLPFLWLDTEESEGEVFWIGARDLA